MRIIIFLLVLGILAFSVAGQEISGGKYNILPIDTVKINSSLNQPVTISINKPNLTDSPVQYNVRTKASEVNTTQNIALNPTQISVNFIRNTNTTIGRQNLPLDLPHEVVLDPMNQEDKQDEPVRPKRSFMGTIIDSFRKMPLISRLFKK